MKITTKPEFFRLWSAGALGYKLRTWDTWAAYDADPDRAGVVGFRQIGTAGGGAFEVTDTHVKAAATATAWTLLGRKFMICEAAPDHLATIQGEVMGRGTDRRGFMGKVVNGKRMRDSIKDGDLKPCGAAASLYMITRFMSASSRDDLDALQDLYPSAVIEFTCYGEHDFDRGRNTIFWEVRDY